MGLDTGEDVGSRGVVSRAKVCHPTIKVNIRLRVGAGIAVEVQNAQTKNACCQAPCTHGVVGSSTCKIWSAATFCRPCFVPLGQRISIVCAVASAPNPKCTRLSLAER